MCSWNLVELPGAQRFWFLSFCSGSWCGFSLRSQFSDSVSKASFWQRWTLPTAGERCWRSAACKHLNICRADTSHWTPAGCSHRRTYSVERLFWLYKPPLSPFTISISVSLFVRAKGPLSSVKAGSCKRQRNAERSEPGRCTLTTCFPP